MEHVDPSAQIRDQRTQQRIRAFKRIRWAEPKTIVDQELFGSTEIEIGEPVKQEHHADTLRGRTNARSGSWGCCGINRNRNRNVISTP